MPFSFLSSTWQIGHLSAKILLFKISTFCFEYCIFKTYAVVSRKILSYKSYLMPLKSVFERFAYFCLPKPPIQKRIKEQSALTCLVLSPLVLGLYDTMLCGLERPGTIRRSSYRRASQLACKLDTSANYVVHTKGIPDMVEGIDLVRDITQGLWLPASRTHLALTGDVDIGNPEIVPAMRIPAAQHQGNRIFLDTKGWSIAANSDPAVACPTFFDGMVETWRCNFHVNGSDAIRILTKELAKPTVWWNISNVDAGGWDIAAEIGGNPWAVLGAQQHETVAKTEVLTVSKGDVKNVFLNKAMKVSMLGVEGGELADSDIADLIARRWPPKSIPGNLTARTVAMEVISAKRKGLGLTVGWGTTEDEGLKLEYWTFIYGIDPKRAEGVQANSTTRSTGTPYFRIHSSTLRLLDTIKGSVIPPPAEQCNKPFVSIATGGIPRYSTCERIRNLTSTGSDMLGQLDTSALYILADTLGRTYGKNSTRALFPNAYKWYLDHEEEIDRLVTSRGYIVGASSTAVTVLVDIDVEAISSLQLMLVLVPIALAVAIQLYAWRILPLNYRSTLLDRLRKGGRNIDEVRNDLEASPAHELNVNPITTPNSPQNPTENISSNKTTQHKHTATGSEAVHTPGRMTDVN